MSRGGGSCPAPGIEAVPPPLDFARDERIFEDCPEVGIELVPAPLDFARDEWALESRVESVGAVQRSHLVRPERSRGAHPQSRCPPHAAHSLATVTSSKGSTWSPTTWPCS